MSNRVKMFGSASKFKVVRLTLDNREQTVLMFSADLWKSWTVSIVLRSTVKSKLSTETNQTTTWPLATAASSRPCLSCFFHWRVQHKDLTSLFISKVSSHFLLTIDELLKAIINASKSPLALWELWRTENGFVVRMDVVINNAATQEETNSLGKNKYAARFLSTRLILSLSSTSTPSAVGTLQDSACFDSPA